jgi:hypothetical protein
VGRGLFDRVEGELAAREKSPGLSMADLLTLPEPQSGLLKWMTRQRAVAYEDVVAFLGGDEAQARRVLAELLEKGWILELEIRGVTQYRVRLAPKRGRALPGNLWQALSDKVEGEEEGRL